MRTISHQTERKFINEKSFGLEEVWAVPTLGGSPRRVVSGSEVLPSPDGTFIFYAKSDNPGIFRAGKSGLNEELLYKSGNNGLFFFPLLLFPGGNDLLAAAVRRNSPNGRIFRINLTSHEAVDLGEIGGSDVAWAEPGNSIFLSRTVNGLTNIWKYGLQDRSLTQITFGTGADFSPMPDPEEKEFTISVADFPGPWRRIMCTQRNRLTSCWRTQLNPSSHEMGSA
jgi:Tol biopolymer transport system component